MPIFTEGDTEVQRSDVTCPSHTVDVQEAAEWVLNSGLRYLRAFAFDVTLHDASGAEASVRQALLKAQPRKGLCVWPWAHRFSGWTVQVDPWVQQSLYCVLLGIFITAAAGKCQTHSRHAGSSCFLKPPFSFSFTSSQYKLGSVPGSRERTGRETEADGSYCM